MPLGTSYEPGWYLLAGQKDLEQGYTYPIFPFLISQDDAIEIGQILDKIFKRQTVTLIDINLPSDLIAKGNQALQNDLAQALAEAEAAALKIGSLRQRLGQIQTPDTIEDNEQKQ